MTIFCASIWLLVGVSIVAQVALMILGQRAERRADMRAEAERVASFRRRIRDLKAREDSRRARAGDAPSCEPARHARLSTWQISLAPPNAVYVCARQSEIARMADIAIELGRNDLTFASVRVVLERLPHWPLLGPVVVDHAAVNLLRWEDLQQLSACNMRAATAHARSPWGA